MLDFDDAAFNYFALTLLCFYLVPNTWWVFCELYEAYFKSSVPDGAARTEAEKVKATKLSSKARGFARINTSQFYTTCIGIVVALTIVMYLFSLVSQQGEMARFDPYDVLGVEPGSEEKVIKKAYRKLALQYHPDKNIGSKVAEEMFQKIKKAQDALLDPVARENFEKYGSPDGKQALEVSIGLPSIILENPKIFLILYLLMMIVVIPLGVRSWYENSKSMGARNNYNTFMKLFDKDECKVMDIPEILAITYECCNINADFSQAFKDPMKRVFRDEKNATLVDEHMRAVVENLFHKMKKDGLMKKPNKLEAFDVKRRDRLKYETLLGTMLLHTYLHRSRLTATKSEEEAAITLLNNNLDRMLELVPDLLENLAEYCKTIGFSETLVESVKFSQRVIQAVWIKQSPFLQLSSNLKKTPADNLQKVGKSLIEFLAMPDDQAKKIVGNIAGISNDIQKEILETRKFLPYFVDIDTKNKYKNGLRVEITHKLFVEEDTNVMAGLDALIHEDMMKNKNEEEEDQVEDKDSSGKNKDETPEDVPVSGDDVYEGDIVTIRVTFDRLDVPHGKEVAPVYAPLFPKTIYESYFLALYNNGRLMQIERVTDRKGIIQVEMKFPAPEKGKGGLCSVTLKIFNECYFDLDYEKKIDFEVKSRDNLPEYEIHPDDKELDDEPTLFEQAMTWNPDDEDSSGSDSDEDQ
jgi:translocation protein SEC63